MKSYFRLLEGMLIMAICFIVITSAIPQSALPDQSGQAVYVTGDNLNSDLFHLKKIKPTESYYENGSFYKIDFVQKNLLKSNQHEYTLNNLPASPDGQWIIDYDLFESTELKWDINYNILSSTDPKHVIKLGRVSNYAWSPQGDRIAYIISLKCDGSSCPGTGWIYNLNNHTKKELNIHAYKVVWPNFDNNIYLDGTLSLGGKILRYYPDTGKLEQTPYKGLNFSQDGKYYYIDSKEGEPCQLYQREPHQKLKEISQDIDKRANTLGWNFWLVDGHSLLLSSKDSATKFIVYDVEKGQVTKTIEGALLGLNRAKTRAVFMTGIDQFKVVDLLAP